MVDDERAVEIILKHKKMRNFSALEDELVGEFHLNDPLEAHNLISRLIREGKIYARGQGSRNVAEDPTGSSDPKAWFERWSS